MKRLLLAFFLFFPLIDFSPSPSIDTIYVNPGDRRLGSTCVVSHSAPESKLERRLHRPSL